MQPLRLQTLKTSAALLLKDFRKAPATLAERLAVLPEFAGQSVEAIIANQEQVRLKHTYRVIALENGFSNWAELKNFIIEKDCLYKPSCVAYVHAWFNHYAEAHAYHKTHGGYLLSFWKDIVICGPEYITCLGLSAYTRQWELIGYNWIDPVNQDAFTILSQAAAAHYLARS